MRKLLILSALAGFGVSCQTGTEYSRELEHVDSLQKVVEDHRARMDSFDTERIKSISTKVDSQFTFISQNHPDTLDREFWKKDLSYLGLIMKNLNRYEENYPELEQSIEYTTGQLKALENSLRDGKLAEKEGLEREEAKKYVHEEVQAVQRIEFDAKRFLPETERALTLWDSLEPRFDSISEYVRRLP